MTDPLRVNPDDVRPEVGDVAVLCRTRTLGEDGTEYPTFNLDTRPSAPEVDELISLATEETLGQLPDVFSDEYYSAVTRLITLRAAVLIELSFFRNQTESTSQMTAMYLADLKSLAATFGDVPIRLR